MLAPAPRRFDVHLHLSRYWPDLGTNRYGPALDFTVGGLLAEMDASGIEAGILLPVHESPSVEETLREGRELLAASGGRLLRTSTVTPTRGAEEVARAVALWEKETDLAALKLFPGYFPFYPHDPRLAPVYEFAHRRGIPVMVHQGDTMDRLGLVKYARPVELDEVAVRYRDVRFVLCHFGNPWMEEASEIVYKNENVYVDTSGLLPPAGAPHFAAAFRRVVRRLENAVAFIGETSRILYGSDWPLEALGSAVGVVEALDLSPEEKDGILGGNARRLFRRPGGPG